MKQYRPTWVEISKRAFSANVRRIKRRISSKVQLLTVLKADAYGHGAKTLAKWAAQSGAHYIGVSSLEEGIELRRARVSLPILILGGVYPLQNFSVAIKKKLIPTVASFPAARYLQSLAKRSHRIVNFHLKVDTGMGRIGVSVEEAKKIIQWVKRQSQVRLTGAYSHFSSADTSPAFTKKQLRKLLSLQQFTRKLGLRRVLFHMANSAGTLRFKRAHLDLVRPGLILYGSSPFDRASEPGFSPVLNWKTKVIFLKKVPRGTPISYGRTFITKRPSKIATLPVGYADGVPRLASNTGHVLVRGKRCPIVGRVTMDHMMVDVTGAAANIGDAVVLIGNQKGRHVSAADWARWARTNSYEILCGISKRVPRVRIS